MIHESLQKSNIFFWSWMTGPSWLDHFHNHHLDYYCKTVTTAKTDSTVSRVDWTETKSTFIVQDLLNMLIPSKQWRWHCLWLKNFCSCFAWHSASCHQTHHEIVILFTIPILKLSFSSTLYRYACCEIIVIYFQHFLPFSVSLFIFLPSVHSLPIPSVEGHDRKSHDQPPNFDDGNVGAQHPDAVLNFMELGHNPWCFYNVIHGIYNSDLW